MSHQEQPPEPAGPAETTLPLPAVEPGPDSPAARAAGDQPTTALPLIDLLAPKKDEPAPAAGPIRPAGAQPPPLAGPPPAGQVPLGGPPAPPHRSRSLGWPVVAAIGLAVLLLGLIGWLAVRSLPTNGRTAASTAPTTSAVRVADGYQFTQRAARTDTDCAGNSYGQVAEFFRSTPCAGLRRYLFTSSVDGRPVVVSVAAATMSDEQTAAAFKTLADTNGTGNVADLLRAGVRVPAVPDRLTEASYASTRSGSTVVIVEADYTDPGLPTDSPLERLGNAALQLGG